jgi:signal peptidase II
VAVVVAAVVVAVDQITKTWAVHRLSHGSIHVVWKLDLELAYNSGSAFSLLQGWAPVFVVLAVIAVGVLLHVVGRAQSTALSVALGLVVGGALGNLSDRLLRPDHGAVVDFVALHFWPTFNVADSCIVVGGILAALIIWRGEPAG